MTVFERHCERLCGQKPVQMHASHRDFVNQLRFELDEPVRIGLLNGKPMKLEIGLVDSQQFNAWATTVGDTDIIAINIGVWPLLVGACRAIMTYPTVFPLIGDPSLETPVILDQVVIGDISMSPTWGLRELKDPARDLHAFLLARIALRYLLHHEMAHIFHGHTIWMQQVGPLAVLNEARVHLPGISPIQSQTLEYDADVGSVQRVLGETLNARLDEAHTPHKWILPGMNQFGGPMDALAAVAAGIQVVHILFSRFVELDSPGAEFASHPPWIVRQYYNIMMLAESMRVRCGWDYIEASQAPLAAATDVSTAFFSVVERTNLEHFTPERRARVENFLLQYTECYRDLYPKLDKLKRGGTLAVPGGIN